MSHVGDACAIERSLSQRDFDAFARLSGDANPIHVDPGFAARSRFGRTVAHGLLLATVLRGLVDQLFPGAHLADQKLMFPAPSYAGEPLRFEVNVTARTGDAATLALEVTRVADGEVTCRGQCRLDLEVSVEGG